MHGGETMTATVAALLPELITLRDSIDLIKKLKTFGRRDATTERPGVV